MMNSGGGFSIRLKLYILTILGVAGTFFAMVVFFLLMQYANGAFSGALKETVAGDTRVFEMIRDIATTQGVLQQINREQDLEKIETLATQYENDIAMVEKRMQADFPDAGNACRVVWTELKSVNNKTMDMILKGQQAMALQMIASQSNPLFEKLLKIIDQQREDTNQKRSAQLDLVSGRVRNILVVFVVLSVIVSLIFLFSGIYISRGITKNISQALEMLKQIAQGEGDLTKRLHIQTKDEVGELALWFNRFVEYLEGIIKRLKDTATHMDASTQEVAEGTQGLSQSTQEQAAAIEEVAATIEQMTASIKQNAENASDARSKTQEMVHMANTGTEFAQQLIRAMGEMSSASKKIGDIITTVNEVAFQTNLLALNAAVEAARAGQHGKGFAVVAEEVRALARRSAEAARQIKGLIEDTVQKVGEGDSLVKKSGESLQQISTHIQDLSQVMEDIAAASGEQATGVDEVNRAVSQIDSSTQQNASTVEELASTSDSLSNEAQELADTVARFKVGRE